MTSRRIGTRAEWLAASAKLLEREKELTRMGDELARQRRELPWVPVEKEYTLQTEDGARTLTELFDGRSQLVVYHFMFGPGYTGRMSLLLVDRRQLQRRTRPPQRPRRDDDLRIPRAARQAARLPRADGLELHLGLQPRQRLQRRLRRIGRRTG